MPLLHQRKLNSDLCISLEWKRVKYGMADISPIRRETAYDAK